MLLLWMAVTLAACDPAAARATLEHDAILVDAAVPQTALQSLCEAAANLPPAFKRAPGVPLVIDWNPTPQPFGLGDGSPTAPEWKDQRFQLYAYRESPERRASFRLAALTLEQREDLWRRRALVHALMRRWDDAHQLSASATWHRATSWLRPLDRPLTWKERSLNTFEGAYSRQRGMASAALDLATFAEEALVPADHLPPDDQLQCQEFSKLRALRALLHDQLADALPDTRTCPAFDRWAGFDTLDSIEVLLVSASGRAPESLFGHIAVRLVRRPGEFVEGPDFGTVVQLVALNGAEQSGWRYLWKGLSGGYSLATVTSTFGDLLLESTRFEQRTVRRFRLKLSPTEQQRLVERIWETERRSYQPYYFFTENCGTALLSLLNGALEEPHGVARPSGLWVAPSSVLDALAPWLEPVPAPLPSSLDHAREASRARARTLDALAQRAPAFASQLRTWQANRPVRAEALPALLQQGLEGASDEVRQLAYDYLRRTIEIERSAAELAQADRLRIELQALTDKESGRSSDELVQERQRDFEVESDISRRQAALARAAFTLDALDRASKRPFSPAERELIERAHDEAASFRKLMRIVGTAVDQHFQNVDPIEWEQRASDARASAWSQEQQHSIGRSGLGRLEVAGGAVWQNASIQPLLSVHTAAMSEVLGDQRLRGFQRGTELRVLDGTLDLALRAGWPQVVRSQLTALSYRSVARPAEALRRSLIDQLGWGFALDWNYRSNQPLPQQGRGRIELLAVLDENASWSRLSVLGVGLESRTQWNSEQLSTAIAPRLSWTQRLPLGAHALRMDAAFSPGFDPFSRRWSAAGEASLRGELLVRTAGGREWHLTPGVSADYLNGRWMMLTTLGLESLGRR